MAEAEASPRVGPLRDLRILDLSRHFPGGRATLLLADLGADVIKVEPLDGDPMRHRMEDERGLSLPFAMIHRNKRSIAIDLKTGRGQQLLQDITATADVFVENFRPGALATLGLGYPELQQRSPDLVYCSISGFGQTGPNRALKGVDLIAQAYGGLLSVTGAPDGRLAKAGYPISDLGSAMWGAIGILAALQRVRQGAGGAYIDVSLADTIAAWSLWETAEYSVTGNIPAPLGTAQRLAAPYQVFECSDTKGIAVAAGDRLWPRLCAALDVRELESDPRYSTEDDRFVHRAELYKALGERFRTAPRDQWIAALRGLGIPCGPVNDIAEVLADDQYDARRIFVREESLEHPVLVNTPVVSDGAPGIRGRAPRLGEDTTSLLRELGVADEEIEQLLEARVIADGETPEEGHR